MVRVGGTSISLYATEAWNPKCNKGVRVVDRGVIKVYRVVMMVIRVLQGY
jgi:hypothetical protein